VYICFFCACEGGKEGGVDDGVDEVKGVELVPSRWMTVAFPTEFSEIHKSVGLLFLNGY